VNAESKKEKKEKNDICFCFFCSLPGRPDELVKKVAQNVASSMVCQVLNMCCGKKVAQKFELLLYLSKNCPKG
jgi:hypothetical protein